MELKQDMLHLFRVKDIGYNEEGHKIEYQLSKEYVSIDKGRAIYWHGFNKLGHYVLIGFMRALFGEPARSEILGTAYKIGDYFVFGNDKWAVIWTGEWNHLERVGLSSVTLQTSVFEAMINEIYNNIKEHEGKLQDRG